MRNIFIQILLHLTTIDFKNTPSEHSLFTGCPESPDAVENFHFKLCNIDTNNIFPVFFHQLFECFCLVHSFGNFNT